ncbi:MAG: helix-turn-helix domain-containing protein [Deltaproteobacteria bacterium]|nr:helix-turn-helix domain-containing protein [Candidatus Tharpellaceae bacterium]
MKVVKNYNEHIGSIEVAKLLDISPDDVNCMARKGALSGYKEGRIWRFNKQTVDRWIKAHKLSETI